jgi:hypothetical protein
MGGKSLSAMRISALRHEVTTKSTLSAYLSSDLYGTAIESKTRRMSKLAPELIVCEELVSQNACAIGLCAGSQFKA